MQHLKESLAKLVLETSTNFSRCPSRPLRRHEARPRDAVSWALTRLRSTSTWHATGRCRSARIRACHVRNQDAGRTNQIEIARTIRDVIVDATKDGTLRPNQVDSLTGKNSGNNLGEGTPVIHCEQWEQEEIEVRLILKGEGAKTRTFNTPSVRAAGARTCRQEYRRRPQVHTSLSVPGAGSWMQRGAIGVAIGGDRASGYHFAKQQLFPHAGRYQTRTPSLRSSKRMLWKLPQAWDRHDGLRRGGEPDRLQGRRLSPASGEFLCFRRVRLLGVQAARRYSGCADRRDPPLALQDDTPAVHMARSQGLPSRDARSG